MSLLDYVSSFRKRLHKACEVAKAHLSVAQGKMKQQFDKKSVRRNLQVGDNVLVLCLCLVLLASEVFQDHMSSSKSSVRLITLFKPLIVDVKLEFVM